MATISIAYAWSAVQAPIKSTPPSTGRAIAVTRSIRLGNVDGFSSGSLRRVLYGGGGGGGVCMRFRVRVERFRLSARNHVSRGVYLRISKRGRDNIARAYQFREQ